MYDNYSIDDMTLLGCKKFNRYQRWQYFESKSINKLLDAIKKGYVPVGKYVPTLERPIHRKKKK